ASRHGGIRLDARPASGRNPGFLDDSADAGRPDAVNGGQRLIYLVGLQCPRCLDLVVHPNDYAGIQTMRVRWRCWTDNHDELSALRELRHHVLVAAARWLVGPFDRSFVNL